MDFPILSAIFLLPLMAAFIMCLLPSEAHDSVRRVAAAATGLALALTV